MQIHSSRPEFWTQFWTKVPCWAGNALEPWGFEPRPRVEKSRSIVENSAMEIIVGAIVGAQVPNCRLKTLAAPRMQSLISTLLASAFNNVIKIRAGASLAATGLGGGEMLHHKNDAQRARHARYGKGHLSAPIFSTRQFFSILLQAGRRDVSWKPPWARRPSVLAKYPGPTASYTVTSLPIGRPPTSRAAALFRVTFCPPIVRRDFVSRRLLRFLASPRRWLGRWRQHACSSPTARL